jgi:hypothetical protein
MELPARQFLLKQKMERTGYTRAKMAIMIHGPQVTYFGTKQELATLHDLRPDTHVIDTETGDNGFYNGSSLVWTSDMTSGPIHIPGINLDGGNANTNYGGIGSTDGGSA